jgi:serpin B
MGAHLTFSPEADFSDLSKTKPLWISEAKHKAVIEVNEEGTEAAAVTSLGFNSAGPPSSQEKGFVFTADRPFLVAIQEQETGSILFLSRVVKP